MRHGLHSTTSSDARATSEALLRKSRIERAVAANCGQTRGTTYPCLGRCAHLFAIGPPSLYNYLLTKDKEEDLPAVWHNAWEAQMVRAHNGVRGEELQR